MGEKTRIEWTDATWNPVYGCSEVSPGCDNCYARREMERFRRPWVLTRAGESTFFAPLRWKAPRRIFACSWGDLFHRDVPEEWLAEIWSIIRATPHHTYLLLTKRPGRMAWWASRYGWPDNAWAGTSVESSKYLPRIDVLARVPAPIRFVSAEPLLSALDLRRWLEPTRCPQCDWHQSWFTGSCDRCGVVRTDGRVLDWTICGGESGPQARPMHPAWVLSLRDQCQEALVPFFFKQWGTWVPFVAGGATPPTSIQERGWRTGYLGQDGVLRPRTFDQRRDESLVVRTGKKIAGAMLNGREWREVPEVRGDDGPSYSRPAGC